MIPRPSKFSGFDANKSVPLTLDLAYIPLSTAPVVEGLWRPENGFRRGAAARDASCCPPASRRWQAGWWRGPMASIDQLILFRII